MKISSRLRAASAAGLFALVVTVAVPSTIGATDRAEATAPTIHTHNVVAPGFETMKSSLVSSQKRALLKYANAHPAVVSMTCTGYAGYNYLHKPTGFIKKLAVARARKACDFVNSHLDSAADTVIRSVTTTSQDSSVRKVVVRFSVTDEALYRFSWNYADDGTIYIGPSSTAIVSEVINLPTIPDDASAGDVIPGDDFFGGGPIFDAGGAAYFGGWCTTPDGTGTMYWAGSGTTLPDAGPGIITLYAIYSQG